jgi:preprotein translocase subunit YajC
MAIDREKDMEELVSNIKVGDIVCLNDKTCHRVTNLSLHNKKIVEIALNNKKVEIKELKNTIYALYRIGDNNEVYLFGDLDYSKKEE